MEQGGTLHYTRAAAESEGRRETNCAGSIAMDNQIDRIRKAEEAMRELLEYSAESRRQLEGIKDPDLRKEVIEAIEGIEKEAQNLNEALQKWRLDIH
jgi:hypothetical protein